MANSAKELGPEHHAEEAGASKLWSVYVDEAERYDKSLVASWKSDMEGMLIFAGLFSASLTAFLIESYKTLAPDPGDATVQLLEQILAVSSGNSTSTPTSAIVQTFKPSLSSLVCNALWFMSLGLSLSCALVATLLEQWARDFLHRANTRSSPVVRARIYSYLYYGLRRFKMHAVVDIIPSLLHAALLFFFCGLVVFLIPVNKIIAGLVTGILALVAGFYAFLTILPSIRFDSPYRTPLSSAVWAVLQAFSGLRGCRSDSVDLTDQIIKATLFWSSHSPPHRPNSQSDCGRQKSNLNTLVDNMIGRAIMPSDNRHNRDVSALLWTVSSLSDDDELQTFVEAIPDVMWGQHRQHRRNTAYMTSLRDSEEANLTSRIADLWRSCQEGPLSVGASQRRQVACLKAAWALCTIPTAPRSLLTAPYTVPLILDHFLFPIPMVWDYPYFASPLYDSAKAMRSWSGLAWLTTYLKYCSSQLVTAAPRFPYLAPVRRYLMDPSQTHERGLNEADFQRLERSESTINPQQFDQVSREICTSLARRLFLTLDLIYPPDYKADFLTDDNLTEIEAEMILVDLDNLDSDKPRTGRREARPYDARIIPRSLIEYLLPPHQLGNASDDFKVYLVNGSGSRVIGQDVTSSWFNNEIDAATVNALLSSNPDYQSGAPPRTGLTTGPKLATVVAILTEFLEQCVPDITQMYEPVASLRTILDLPSTHLHQTRFARAMRKLTDGLMDPRGRDLVRMVLQSRIFDPYQGQERFHWIIDDDARQDILQAQSYSQSTLDNRPKH
ncbi:hypothetical protein MIND_01214700 [Mycena indigotica]|uniref:DUF6535 domain-containing protein n=1 Tax=Mycena indigotica TaxID=2126181 RepID=A0A8H6VXL5_9AGAR|nr:uncharacterized protein MIND_01214700 [Mycena indigotica]KAF7291894.1 hypothetical protein MIND_01214700 [Mycena indigotica]